MNKKIDIKLENYGITKNRALELQYFCRQYPEWKRFLRDNVDTVSPGMRIDDVPTEWDAGRGRVKRKAGYAYMDRMESASRMRSNVAQSDAVAELAVERAIRAMKIDIIE